MYSIVYLSLDSRKIPITASVQSTEPTLPPLPFTDGLLMCPVDVFLMQDVQRHASPEKYEPNLQARPHCQLQQPGSSLLRQAPRKERLEQAPQQGPPLRCSQHPPLPTASNYHQLSKGMLSHYLIRQRSASQAINFACKRHALSSLAVVRDAGHHDTMIAEVMRLIQAVLNSCRLPFCSM